jgi:phage gp36-like protein
MSQPLSIELAPSAARTADGSGVPVDLGLVAEVAPRSAAELVITVTDWEDVALLRLVVETSAQESGPWLEVDSLELQETGDHELAVGDTRRWLRLRWELSAAGASPSVSFSVEGEAHQVYIGPRDIGRGLRIEALEKIATSHERAAACIAVSSEADGYLNGRYTLPLKRWDHALRRHCASMAVHYVLDAAGWQPEGPDNVVKTAFDRAVAWFKRLQAGQLEPPDIVDSTPATFDGGSVVVSRSRRGAL